MSRNKKKAYNHAKIMANKKKNKKKQENNGSNSKKKSKVSFNYNRQYNELLDVDDDNLAFNNNQQDIYNYYNSKNNRKDKANKRRGLFIHDRDIESEPEVDDNDNMNIPLRKRKVFFVQCKYNLNEEPKGYFDKFKDDQPKLAKAVNDEEQVDINLENSPSSLSDLSGTSDIELEEEFSEVEHNEDQNESDLEEDFYEVEDTEDEDEVELYNYDNEVNANNGIVNFEPVSDIIHTTEKLALVDPPLDDFTAFGDDQLDDVVTQLDYEIINMQQGVGHNRYNIRCFKIFGDDSYYWVNTDELTDLLSIHVGFPESRHDAFFKHIYNKLIKEKDEADESLFNKFCDNVDMSESEISESLDYLIENVLEDEDEDGLQDMLNFAQNMNKQRTLDIDPQDIPQSKYKIKGKGKKRKLIMDENKFGPEIVQMLQEKYKLRIKHKAEKRVEKDWFVAQEHATSDNLLLKYPYGIDVLSLRAEIESFAANHKKWLVGSKRSFPSFDTSGNKTVIKFGKHFNLGHKKLVSKQRHYIQLVKTKQTIKKEFNYLHVDLLCRQRQIFMRKDVKMPRDLAIRFNGEQLETEKVKRSMQDGAVVAEGAKQLTSENLGFRMLSKMGWSKGMALGNKDLDAIKEPVKAIIKKGRKGLGHAG